MPREVGSLRRFIDRLSAGEGWLWGEPWMSSEGHAVLLPILSDTTDARRYVLGNEVVDHIRGEDLGRIDRLRIVNDSESRVLLPSGTLFRGVGTQSRAITAGVVVEPRASVDVDVKCIEASQVVVAGASLSFVPQGAPPAIHQALLRRDQGAVWTLVRSVGLGTSSSSDDLVDLVSDKLQTADVRRFLRTIPSRERECGAVVLDERGVVAVEWFDRPEAWKTASDRFYRQHLSTLRRNPRTAFKVVPDAGEAIALSTAFLTRVADGSTVRIGPHSWIGTEIPAESTFVHRELAHFIAFRPSDSKTEETAVRLNGQESHAIPSADMGEDDTWSSSPADDLDGEVVSESRPTVLDDDGEPFQSRSKAPNRKVLTSGWDPRTFGALEHYSHKEFEGDRSAALRHLVRVELRQRGYLGPFLDSSPTQTLEGRNRELASVPDDEMERHPETRIRDLERIVQTPRYATWLRTRAKVELERLASIPSAAVQAIAREALGQLSPIEPTSATTESSAGPEIPLAPERPPVQPEPLPVDVRGLLREALTASAGGEFTRALKLLDDVLEQEPDNPTALLGRAIAFGRTGRSQEALADLDIVLRLQPTNAAALMNRARIHQDRGDLTSALEVFDSLKKIAPNDWDVWKARGDLLMRMGRDQEALGAFVEALRRNPEDEKLQRRLHALESSSEAPRGPVAPPASSAAGIEEGQTYLVKEKRPEIGFRTLKGLAARNVPTMIVTYQATDRVRQDTGLVDTKILRLSHSTGREVLSPTAVPALAKAIEHFIEGNEGRGAIMLDGLEYLIANNGFREAVLFLEHLNEFILQRRAILIVPLAPDAVSDREFALLERTLKILS